MSSGSYSGIERVEPVFGLNFGTNTIAKIVPPFPDILKSLLFATLAYEEPSMFESKFNELCPKEFKDALKNDLDVAFMEYIDASQFRDCCEDTQCYVWCKNNTVYMVFRGTQGSSDAVADLDMQTHSMSKSSARVHKGFYEQFRAVSKPLVHFLKDNEGEYNRLVITGHSLGGALATIAGAYFSHLYLGIEVVVHTFGSPRVGNKAFGKYFKEHIAEHWRVINEEDPAPLVPMSWRYSHVLGNTLCLDDEGGGRYTVSQKGDSEWYLRCGVTFNTVDWCSLYEPHSTAMYLKNVTQLALIK